MTTQLAFDDILHPERDPQILPADAERLANQLLKQFEADQIALVETHPDILAQLKDLAQNGNIPLDLLRQLFQTLPHFAIQNPALSLALLENPDLLRRWILDELNAGRWKFDFLADLVRATAINPALATELTSACIAALQDHLATKKFARDTRDDFRLTVGSQLTILRIQNPGYAIPDIRGPLGPINLSPQLVSGASNGLPLITEEITSEQLVTTLNSIYLNPKHDRHWMPSYLLKVLILKRLAAIEESLPATSALVLETVLTESGQYARNILSSADPSPGQRRDLYDIAVQLLIEIENLLPQSTALIELGRSVRVDTVPLFHLVAKKFQQLPGHLNVVAWRHIAHAWLGEALEIESPATDTFAAAIALPLTPNPIASLWAFITEYFPREALLTWATFHVRDLDETCFTWELFYWEKIETMYQNSFDEYFVRCIISSEHYRWMLGWLIHIGQSQHIGQPDRDVLQEKSTEYTFAKVPLDEIRSHRRTH